MQQLLLICLTCDFGQDGKSFYRYNMCDKVRDFINLAKYQYDSKICFLCKLVQQCPELVAGLGVQADKGVVHYEDTRSCSQGLGKLELA